MVCSELDLRIEFFAKGIHLSFWRVSCDKYQIAVQIVNTQIHLRLQVG